MAIKKVQGDWLIVVLGVVLLVPTAVHTVNLMSTTMPSGLWWLSFFTLVAIDAGVMIWSHYFMKQAKNTAQTVISGAMVGVCLTGVAFGLFGDTAYQVAKSQALVKPNNSDFVLWAIMIQSAIIFINVVATIIVPMLSPQAQLERQSRALQQEAAEMRNNAHYQELIQQIQVTRKINDARFRAINANAEMIALESANVYAAQFVQEERNRVAPIRILTNNGYLSPPMALQHSYSVNPLQHQPIDVTPSQPATIHVIQPVIEPVQQPLQPALNAVNVTPSVTLPPVTPAIMSTTKPLQPAMVTYAADGGSEPREEAEPGNGNTTFRN